MAFKSKNFENETERNQFFVKPEIFKNAKNLIDKIPTVITNERLRGS